MASKEENEEFNIMTDIENIHNYLENKETSKLVEIICKRSNSQRQKIKETYYSNYGTELGKELNSKLSGKIKELIEGVMMTPEEYDVNGIYDAIAGLGTDELRLSEILATRPSRHLFQVKEKYPLLKKETLDQAIIGDTSGCYQKILIAMAQGKRSDNPYPNSQKMKEIVEKLKPNDKGKIAEDVLVQYFSTCSYGEICTICRFFEKTYNQSILDAIKKSCDKDTYNFCNIFLQYIADPGTYFAKVLHEFKEKDLNRILIAKSEVNMDEIRDAYKELYNTDFINDLKEKTSGDYQLGLTILAQKE